jgi:hypothetical protein
MFRQAPGRLLRRFSPRNDLQLYPVRFTPNTNYYYLLGHCEPDEGGRGNP